MPLLHGPDLEPSTLDAVTEPGDDKPKTSAARIGLWVVVAGIALYYLVSGLIGIISNG